METGTAWTWTCTGQALTRDHEERVRGRRPIYPSMMDGRAETDEVMQGWKRGENVPTSVCFPSLNQSLIL